MCTNTRGTTGDQLSIDHDLAENAIDTAQDHIEEAEDELPDSYYPDLDDVEDRLDTVDNAVDDHQDGEGDNPLGPVPATLNYLQHVVENLEDQIYTDGIAALDEDLERIEELVVDDAITQTKWYASVNDIPGLYDEQEVAPAALKKQGGVDGNPNDHKLHALATPTDDIPDAVKTLPGDDNDPVDLSEDRYTHFATEKTDGGVV